MTTGNAPQSASFWRTSWGTALCVVIAVAALAFIFDHRAHALQWLPFALLLACPLLHLFMHRGHGHGAHRHHDDERPGGSDERR